MSHKCLLLRKTYAPGQKGKRRRRGGGISEYKREMTEKQKLRNIYNCSERQFRNYVESVLQKRARTEDASNLLIEKLESRLDNVVFRFGFAANRSQARQLVSHGHFLINGRPINIPSCLVRKGDKISLSDKAQKKRFFQDIGISLKKHQAPSWLSLDIEKCEGTATGKPTLEETAPPVEISAIFEYYSR